MGSRSHIVKRNTHQLCIMMKYIFILQIFCMGYMVLAKSGAQRHLLLAEEVKNSSCTDNVQCSPGQLCINGTCINNGTDTCTDDDQCSVGKYCDLDTNECTMRGWVWGIIALVVLMFLGGFVASSVSVNVCFY